MTSRYLWQTVAAVGLILSACGLSSDSSGSSATPGAPTDSASSQRALPSDATQLPTTRLDRRSIVPSDRVTTVGSFVLLALGAAATALRCLDAGAAVLPLAGAGWLYAGLLGACVLDCVILGHYGGKLVFH